MPLLHRYRRLPLRAKLSLWVSLGVSAVVVGMMWAMLVALEKSALHSVAQIQAALVEGVGRDVDGKVAMRRDALVLNGPTLGARVAIRQGAELDDFIASRPHLLHLFDALLVSDPAGNIVYSSKGLPPGKPNPPITDRAYFKEAMRTGQMVFSAPLMSRGLVPLPTVFMAAPVRDPQNRIVGMMVGLLALNRANFVSDVSASRLGDAGYLTLTTQDAAPAFIAHPDPRRVTTPVPGGGDPGFAEARRGAPRTVEGADSAGVPALITHRALASAPWILEAVYPTSEAFAGLRDQQRQVVVIGTLAAAASGLIVWWLTTTLLAPLQQLRRALQLDATGSDDLLRSMHADSTDVAALLDAYYAQKARRVATEAALGLSEQRLRGITDNLPASIAYVDAGRVYRHVNQYYRQMFGVDPEALLGKTLAEALGEERYGFMAPYVDGVLRGEAQTYEHHITVRPEPADFLVNFVPDLNADGRVVGFYALILDITARRRAELQLARSERRLKAITDRVPALIAFVDRDERYSFANGQFKTIMGVDPEAVVGQSMAGFLGSAAYGFVRPHVRAALRGEHCRFERTGWEHDDHTHFLFEHVPEIEADGTVSGFVVMVLDISQRRRMELALAQSEQRVRTITDSLPALILHHDRELRYTFANAKAGEAFGFAPADMIGRSLLEVRGERVHAEVAPRMHAALRGETLCFETSDRTGNGPTRWLESHYIPEFDAARAVVGFHALVFDITQRKHDEEQLRASRQLLDRTGAIAGVGGWSLEIASGAVSWTPETRRIHEVDDDFMPTIERVVDFYVDQSRPAIQRAVRRALDSGVAFDLVLPMRTARGQSIWARTTGEVEFEEGRPVRLFGVFQNVSQRVEHERQLREQAELLQVTLKSIGDGVITADELGNVRWMNPAAERMTGWTSEAAAGHATTEVFRIVHADTRAPAQDPVALCLQTLEKAGLPARTVLLSMSGEEIAVEDSASPIHDVGGGLRGAVLVFHDVSEQRRMTDQMTYRATHDPLTGLVNRAEFEGRLARVLARPAEAGVDNAMLFIDLDQFKLVNDACGHAMGDKLLCQVSELLRSAVRSRDTLARLGGDEFAVLLEHCNVVQAQRVAQSICDRMEDYRFVHDGRRFRIGTSIGLIPVDDRFVDAAAAQHAADAACYAAKDAGRNRVHVWFDADAMLRGRDGETQWGSRLEEALDDDHFVLYAQRIESLARPSSGLHFEILIRLREADGSIVAPGRFLPAAERFHMASRIDRWVVRRVFEWLADARRTPADLGTVSVNLSGQSIGDRAFHRYVVELLQELPIDATKLCFEVTETAAITNLGDASAFICEMRELGMRIALDDFGAGASSFGYLKNLTVDYLKIDGQFIRNIETDPLDMAAVRCFHEVARAIGVETIAEFVETDAIREVLRGIGIDHVQGYLVHKPEPLDDLLRKAQAAATAPARLADATVG